MAAGRFRVQPPQRVSDRAAVDLQNEYLRSASIFEQQLCLLTCLAKIERGKSKPWPYWQKQNLNNLMAMAAADHELLPLISVLDRHVRNALTHGTPIIERPPSTWNSTESSGLRRQINEWTTGRCPGEEISTCCPAARATEITTDKSRSIRSSRST